MSYDGSHYACADGETCPLGFECVQNVCVEPGGAPDASTIDAKPPVDAMPPSDSITAQTWIDDSAEDFAGGTLAQAAVAARGAVEPFAYYTGGVIVHASDVSALGAAATSTWDQVQAFTPTGKVALARAAEHAWGSSETPAGLGLTNGDAWTQWFEGEVWLDAGAWTFFYDVDDHGFVELATPGSDAFQRVVDADFPNTGQGDFFADAGGWYPIRWVASDGGGSAGFRLRFKGPGVASATVVARDRLRARVDDVAGLLVTGFTDERLLGDLQQSVDPAPADIDWASGRPTDLGVPSDDHFSVRWAGQVRIDTGGSYGFRYQSDDGQRLWIDGTRLLDAWDAFAHDQLTPVVNLEAGWHDVVIDQSEAGGDASARLSIASGPALVGATLPPDCLRPVEARSERFETAVNRTDVTIPDQTTVQTTVALLAPAGATVAGIDVSFTFDHTYPGDLVMTLIAPNGASTVLRNRTGGDPDAVGEVDRFQRSNLDGAPVTGTWTLRVADQDVQDSGVLRDFQLTVHYAGGQAPIPTSASYESPVHDLGGVVAIDRVAWTARTPKNATLDVALRSCDVAADCATEAWSTPLTDPAGAAPDVAPRRFVQYRVELTSTGDTAASLESIEIDYRTAP